MRKGIILSLLMHLSVFAMAQSHEGQVDSALMPKLSYHYQSEYTFDKPIKPESWNSEAGMHVGFGTTDQLYFRAEVPILKKDSKEWKGVAWKGERLNAQIVVWSSDTLQQVRFKVNNLVNERGDVISKDNIKLNMVRYVLANYPYGANDVVCGDSPYKNGFLMPDRFEQFDRFDVPGKTARPVWVGLDLPAGTAAGHYKGTIEVKAKGFQTLLKFEVEVQDQVLPPPHDWKYRLDLWQNPWVLAWDNHLEPWSEEHKLLLKKHLKLYADAGGKYITTYAVHSPWSDNSYSIEGGMIESIKQADGKWKFDYKIFDEYVELCMSVGIDKAITVYTPLPGGFRFRYIDAKTGEYVTETWPPTSEKFKAYWNPFLDDLQAHLRQKGWFDKTYIGINENPMEETLAAIKVVKENSAKWRITYAGDWHPELNDLLDDYSYVARKESSMDVVKDRTAKGFTTTYYVCCNPPKPNNFLFSPPIEGRWISWYASAYGYNGFLRWAYDAWTQDPVRDSRHGTWAAGDCYLVYPGGNSGIRFEKLREGIVDFEKLRILKDLASKTTDKKVQKIMAELSAHLTTLTTEHGYNEDSLKTQIYVGQKMIKDLSDRLSRK
jgi:hypothetical protein